MSILLHLKYALVCSLYARLFIARMAFFWRTKILEVLFWYVPCQASIPCDKYGWISEVYNVFRIVSGRKRFSLYKSPIDFATLPDLGINWSWHKLYAVRVLVIRSVLSKLSWQIVWFWSWSLTLVAYLSCCFYFSLSRGPLYRGVRLCSCRVFEKCDECCVSLGYFLYYYPASLLSSITLTSNCLCSLLLLR